MPRHRIKAPAFQCYPKDFVSDLHVQAMRLDELGAYWYLCCLYWIERGLPDDPAYLARALKISRTRFDRLWRSIGPCFVRRGTRLQHKRLDRERARQVRWRRKMAKAGRKGADSRWHPSAWPSHGLAIARPMAHDGSASASAVRTDPPYSPPLQGGRRITRAERTTARTILSRNLGSCPHEPRCPTSEQCVDLIAVARRVKAQAS